MRKFQRIVVVIVVALWAPALPLRAASIRVTTWNLEWFPNGIAEGIAGSATGETDRGSG